MQAAALETVACNLCQSDGVAWSSVYRDHSDPRVTYRLVKCQNCGLVYLNPRLGREAILACLGAYQRLLREMREKVMGSATGRLGIRLLRQARVPPGDPRGRSILDVGCATGEYLCYLRELGWDVAGIELDPEAARHAREVFGLDARVGGAETALAGFPEGRFDVVSMWHVLEHLDDPTYVLREVRRVLKPGGSLLVEVPNFGSIWRLLLRGNWFPFEYPHHRYHFTKATLRVILSRAGFAVSAMVGQPAPAETIWSFCMLWNAIRGQSWDGHLLWSPSAVALLYPVEIVLAWLGCTNHLRAVGVRL